MSPVMHCSRCAEIAGGLQILVRALLQKRDLASRAHEVMCALTDASKVGLSQVNSTAAALAGLDAIMYYRALLCPDMAGSVLGRPPQLQRWCDRYGLVIAHEQFLAQARVPMLIGITSCQRHVYRHPNKLSFCMQKYHLMTNVLQGP